MNTMFFDHISLRQRARQQHATKKNYSRTPLIRAMVIRDRAATKKEKEDGRSASWKSFWIINSLFKPNYQRRGQNFGNMIASKLRNYNYNLLLCSYESELLVRPFVILAAFCHVFCPSVPAVHFRVSDGIFATIHSSEASAFCDKLLRGIFSEC